MWQRIQTLYLFLALCLNIFLFTIDLAQLKVGNLWHNFDLFGLADTDSGMVLYDTVILVALTAISALLSLIVILMFKKRQLQIKLSQLNLMLQAGLVAAIFFFIEAAAENLTSDGGIEIEYEGGVIVSLVPLIFIFLAIKAIKKDEALVRAADRIR